MIFTRMESAEARSRNNNLCGDTIYMSAKTPVLRGKSNLGITVDSLEDGKNLVSAHHHLWQLYFLIEPNAAEGDSKKE